jgi:TPR repeat protein
MSDRLELAYQGLIIDIIMVTFPIALVIFAFSGFDIRYGSAKAACKKGSVERCLAVAKTYDEASSGIVGFLLSNVESARTYYDRACSLGSVAACYRLGTTILHGADAATDSHFTKADAARAFDKACGAHLFDACYALGLLYADNRGVDDVWAVKAFSEGCDGGNSRACNQLGVFHVQGRGGLARDSTLALQFFSKACDAKDGPSGACAAVYRFKKTGQLPDAR